MRQSLSDIRPRPITTVSADGRPPIALVLLAVVLAAVLAIAALVDQVGGRSLMQHATALYAPHGKDADSGLMYGLLYSIAATGILFWLLVLRSVRTRSRWAVALTAAVTTIGAALAMLLLGAREYGEQIFPIQWGIIALLSPAVGVVLLVQLLRGRSS
jgi:hypothetical protein